MTITPPQLIKSVYQGWLESGQALALQTRLASADPSIWSDNEQVQASIANRLGWLTCIDLMLEQTQRINEFVSSAITAGYKHCVLLGMGGSSLAPEMFNHLFSDSDRIDPSMTLEVLDNTSPDAVNALSARLDLNSTLFIIASKSGTTIESDSFYRYFYDQLQTHATGSPARHFVAITDPDTPLARQAVEARFFDRFINPANIGGRFSALSYFGMVPAALMGVDIHRLLSNAKAQLNLLTDNSQLTEATRVGVLLGVGAESGMDKLILCLDSYIASLSLWMEQLIAESTGKSGKGIVPVIEVDKAHYRDLSDKIIVQISTDPKAVQDELINLRQDFDDVYRLGAQLLCWEWSTAIAGAVMKINPFDEPNVSEAKAATLEVLKTAEPAPVIHNESDVLLKQGNRLIANESQIVAALSAFQASIKKADYLAILCYAQDKTPLDNAFAAYRLKLVEEKSIATTLALGPRYLHSIGQLHKGGADNGVFILVTTDHAHQVDIPGKNYNFNQLNNAQAQGDLNVLQDHQRRLIHLHLKNLKPSSLDALARLLIQSII